MLGKGNIFLIGPMGSGKTAVGRHLSRMLRFTFHDSDADVEARTGVDIAFIFEKEGESGFRLRCKGEDPVDRYVVHTESNCWKAVEPIRV